MFEFFMVMTGVARGLEPRRMYSHGLLCGSRRAEEALLTMKELKCSATKTQKLVTPAFLVRGPRLVILLGFQWFR